jgi:NADP-dependent 3-hydroxy acid dehydrogenase YdfG
VSQQTIIISGTSSGFGAAQDLPSSGHRVFATMRDTTSRNKPAATRLRAYGRAIYISLTAQPSYITIFMSNEVVSNMSFIAFY